MPLAPPTTPNFAGLAVGTAPDYLGSDDYIVGPAPIVRYQFENQQRYVFLYGNALGSNIIDHPWLRTGPTAIYRFGRNDPNDDVVAALEDVDASLDLGWTIGAEYIAPDNPGRRARLDAFVNTDVTGSHSGTVLGLGATGWTPTPFALVGAYAGLTWADDNYTSTYFDVSPEGADASGLAAFDAGAGARDVRGALVAVVPATESWLLGVGVIYSRLLGDAADSPIVADQGSPGQLIAGVGAAFVW